ncbi:hypothetical protein APHAL10511_005121 [Amanita phalloides]|nr:hypothetical protein APHAL10511_005121 [Amanita phalloides]
MSMRDEEYYVDSMMIIRVQDRLFKVPQHILTTNSPVFRDMLNLPIPKDSEPDGSSDGQPLVLEGIKASEFACLLKCIYPLKFRGKSFNFTLDEWKGVLGLAGAYEMVDVKAFAVEEMTPLISGLPAIQVHLSQVYDIKQWLVSGAHELVQRAEPLHAFDIEIMGAGYAAIIMSLREGRSRGFMISSKTYMFDKTDDRFLARLGL